MPIRVKFTFDEHRYSEIVAGLRRVDTPGVLRKIDLAPYQKKALLFLRRVFPYSGAKGSTNQLEFKAHLIDGWRVNRIIMATTVGFSLDHVLRGNRRANRVLDVLDRGSSAWTFITNKTLRFRDNRVKKAWVTMSAGAAIHHRDHPGSEYREKTFTFINEVLLPQIRKEVTRVIRKEVNG